MMWKTLTKMSFIVTIVYIRKISAYLEPDSLDNNIKRVYLGITVQP